MQGISIIIPTYNREGFIREAIESILIQEYNGKIEIIVSDDGSTDRTLQIAYSYAGKVQVILKPNECKTQGASGARNRGIKAATQPYILFLDSDDFFLPGHLELMVKTIESEPNLGFGFCKTLEFDDSQGSRLYRNWTKINITQKDISNLIVSSIYVANTNVFIFKKNVFDVVGVFNENVKIGEDSDLWMRISERFSGKFSDHYGAVIRLHKFDQLTKSPKKSLLNNHVEVFGNAVKRYFELGLSDKYRLFKLLFLVLKYKISQFPVFYTLYIFKYQYNKRKRANEEKWQPLSFFLK